MLKRIITLVFFSLIVSAGFLSAQGVELNPAYITGSVDLSNADWSDTVRSATIYANAEGGFTASTSVAEDGSYSLTVNAPADGSSREYEIYARMYLRTGNVQFGTDPETVAVIKEESYTQDLSASLASLTLTYEPQNGRMRSGNVLIYSASGEPYLYFNHSSSNPGEDDGYSVTMDFPANITTNWIWNNAYPEDSETFQGTSLDKTNFTVSPGEEKELTFSFTFPDAPPPPETGTLKGTMEFLNPPAGWNFYRNYFYSPYTTLTSNPASFEVEYNTGQHRLYANSQFRKDDGSSLSYSWPYSLVSDDDGIVEIVAGETTEWNPTVETTGSVSGTYQFTGVASLADLQPSYRQVRASGIYGTDSYGGYASMSGLPVTGEFTLPLFEGSWYVGNYISSIYFTRTSDDPMEYIYTYHSGFTNPDITEPIQINDGTHITGYDIEIPTGSVKIKYAVTDGSLISSPNASFQFRRYDENGTLISSGSGSASGPSDQLEESQLTIVGPPGEYEISARAYVNGSNVTFNPKTVIVIEGVEQVLEIDGPSLTVTSPQAELYTYDESITVSGIADDDVQVASITLNGEDLAFSSTSNPDAPSQVTFSTDVPLVNGPNEFTVEVTDTSGKIARDTRYVYRDSGPPSLSFTPPTSSTEELSVTVEGTASDDNVISKVYINGLSVDFESTNNPDDPSQVSFSKVLDLNEGANAITVTVVDNTKRSTSETHVVTQQDEDLIPPVFTNAVNGELPDVTLEQTSPQGTAYVLPVPAVEDETDPDVAVTNNAPDVFLPGENLVTWTAEDDMGNTAMATQTVIVVDTTAPEIQAPADISLEYSGVVLDISLLGTVQVSDAADPSPVLTNDAPQVLPLGQTTVAWTATDLSGNSSSDTQLVTVVDTSAPVFPVLDTVVLEAEGPDGTAAVLETPEAEDAADSDLLITNDAPAVFPLGDTQVTWTAEDDSGNIAQAVQTVSVQDGTAPELTAPSNRTIEYSGKAYDPTILGSPAATDLVDPAPVITNDAPAILPIGTVSVTWTATDSYGNSSSAVQTITVEDTTAPVISGIVDVVLEQETFEGTAYVLDPPLVTDAADDSPSLTSDAPAIFPAGVTEVIWTAKDVHGNISTAVQLVTVQDTTAPAIAPVENITLEAVSPDGIQIILDTPGVSDAADPAPTVVNDAPDTFPLGDTVVTWTATDSAGNSAQATQTVSVEDSSAPAIQAPDTVTLEYSGQSVDPSALGTPVVEDAVDPQPETGYTEPDSYVLGENEITWFATDFSGNTAYAVQTVVLVDTTAPEIVQPSDITLEQTSFEGTAYSLNTPAVTDIADPAPAIVSDAPAVFPQGETVVTWTATDASGNSSSMTQTVTVEDTTAPVILELNNITLQAQSSEGTAHELIVPEVKDTADPAPSITNDAPELFPLGETVVTWTATDSSGNSSSVVQIVRVVDTIAPELDVDLYHFRIIRNWLMQPVYIEFSAEDNIDGNLDDEVRLISVSSDEEVDSVTSRRQSYGNGIGLSDKLDIIIICDNLVLVRGEYDLDGDGRVYTFNFEVEDSSGNVTRVSKTVDVRKRWWQPAVDSGEAYSVTPDDEWWEGLSYRDWYKQWREIIRYKFSEWNDDRGRGRWR